MAIEKGKCFYIAAHAYHHFIGEVVESFHPARKECILKNVIRVQSCSRGWTEFWRDGCKNDTTFTVWPDGTEVSNWLFAVPWNHPIPKGKGNV
jgi:hypothetical protein